MAAKVPEFFDGARGIVASPKASENPGIVADDALAIGNENDIPAVELRKACTLDVLVEGYDGPKPGEHEWGEPAGKEMW